MESFTPSQVIQELQRIQSEASKGVQALYDAECRLADAENAFERELQLAFMNAQGTVADRTAVSRLQAAEMRLKADLAKAEYNRIKLKMKQLELAQMSTQTIARQIETEMRVLR
jgi:uncharacterized membrane protein YccC